MIVDFKVKTCNFEPKCMSDYLMPPRIKADKISSKGWLFNGIGIKYFLDLLKQTQFKINRYFSDDLIGPLFSKNYDSVVLKFLDICTSIAEHKVLRQMPVFNQAYGWGEGCYYCYTVGRGGYCYFRIKHILALQAFASYSLSRIGLKYF